MRRNFAAASRGKKSLKNFHFFFFLGTNSINRINQTSLAEFNIYTGSRQVEYRRYCHYRCNFCTLVYAKTNCLQYVYEYFHTVIGERTSFTIFTESQLNDDRECNVRCNKLLYGRHAHLSAGRLPEHNGHVCVKRGIAALLWRNETVETTAISRSSTVDS